VTASLDPRTRLATAAARVAQHSAELLVALVDYAASVTATRVEDRDRGRVDGAHLPSWISPEQYRDACRAGLIDGAVIVGRRWVAPWVSVEAWALAGARTAANDSDEQAARKVLERGSQEVAPRGAGRGGR
jgi:hypothetical protein